VNVLLPRIRSFLRRLLVLIIASSAPMAANAEPVRSTLRALVLSGSADQARAKTTLLRELLESTGRFEVRVCETPVGLTAATFAPFDVIIDNLSAEQLGKATEKAIESFVESGKGYVVLHDRLFKFASGKAITWPGFAAMTKLQGSTNRVAETEPLRLFSIKFAQPEHPIIAGLKDAQKTADRIGTLSVKSAATVLMTNEAGQPLVFVSNHGKGRVFVTALGSDLASMQENVFRQTFARGTEWAGSGEVTLPADLGDSTPKAPPVRLMVITGGHDHETSFYDLFSDRTLFGWATVSDSKTAFQKDLRGKYDVLVLYDFTRELDDKAMQNLRDFVEAGKGIVVLHHGILSYQKWPWWYEEVVGGLYRLSRVGDIPNSTVKFGEEHWITPAGQHPITDGIAPFHVTDETYKGLFISPNIKPLLLTDNPTSDRTVAWIGPCTTSKVVFIQLGHDHTPFRHPSYRAFVRRSILWTAGKLN
jgi:type 1 glutamine amidotransferase